MEEFRDGRIVPRAVLEMVAKMWRTARPHPKLSGYIGVSASASW
jgi:hypothetical protein